MIFRVRSVQGVLGSGFRKDTPLSLPILPASVKMGESLRDLRSTRGL